MITGCCNIYIISIHVVLSTLPFFAKYYSQVYNMATLFWDLRIRDEKKFCCIITVKLLIKL